MTRVFPWRTILAWVGAVLLGMVAGIVYGFTLRRRGGLMAGDGIMAQATGLLAGAEVEQMEAERDKARELDDISDSDLLDELGNAASVRAIIAGGRDRVRAVLDTVGPGGRSADESRREIGQLRGEIADVRGAIARARAHRRGDGGSSSGRGGAAAADRDCRP